MLHLFVHQYLFLKCITEFLHWNYHWVFLWFCRLYSDGLALGVWFMTSCCCLVEFGFSCFNHASIESWFANYSIWYSTLIFYTPPLRSAMCLAEDIVERWKNKGRRSRQNTANNKTTPPWQLLYWCRALGYSILEIIVLILRSTFATRFVCFF